MSKYVVDVMWPHIIISIRHHLMVNSLVLNLINSSCRRIILLSIWILNLFLFFPEVIYIDNNERLIWKDKTHCCSVFPFQHNCRWRLWRSWWRRYNSVEYFWSDSLQKLSCFCCRHFVSFFCFVSEKKSKTSSRFI